MPLNKIKMLLQYCHNIAATQFCCRKDQQEKKQFAAGNGNSSGNFVPIILEAILLPELRHANWSFLFNFLFSNLEGSGAKKEKMFH